MEAGCAFCGVKRNRLDMVNTAIVSTVSVVLILHFSTIVSKILVTSITMIMNFFVMKGIIERIWNKNIYYRLF